MILRRSQTKLILISLVAALCLQDCGHQSPEERANPVIVTITTDSMRDEWRLKDFSFFVRINYPELSAAPKGQLAYHIFEAFKQDLILQVISQAYGIRISNDDINRFAKEHLTRLGYSELTDEERQQWHVEVKRRMAIRELLVRKILKMDHVSEEDISAFYEKNESDYKRDQHYLLRFVQTATKESANQFVERLKTATQTFADVGKAFSVNDGHSFAVPMRAKELSEPFAQAIKTMRPGGYSQPIAVTHGDQINYYVLYLEGIVPETQENFDDAYHDIAAELHRRHCRKALKKMLDEFHRSQRFKLEIHNKNLPFDYSEESKKKEV